MIDDFKTSKALLDKTQAFADLNNYRLAVQSVPFTPSPTETYLKETFLGNETDPPGLSAESSDRQDSIYQIDIFTPKGQGGKFAGQAIANLLKIEFPRVSFVLNDGVQKVQISNVSSTIINANKTHNLTVISIDLIVIAVNA